MNVNGSMRAYQRALKTAQRQGLRQGGEAGGKQAMRQGGVTPLTPGATGPGSEQERGWVSRRELESLLGLMQEVEALRVPLVFGRAPGDLALSEGGAVATKSAAWTPARTAASTVVM